MASSVGTIDNDILVVIHHNVEVCSSRFIAASVARIHMASFTSLLLWDSMSLPLLLPAFETVLCGCVVCEGRLVGGGLDGGYHHHLDKVMKTLQVKKEKELFDPEKCSLTLVQLWHVWGSDALC